MSDDKNPKDNNSYDDNLDRNSRFRNDEGHEEERDDKETTSYYHYGPFQSTPSSHESSMTGSDREEPRTMPERDVEMTVPEPVRSFRVEQQSAAAAVSSFSAASAHAPAPKKRSSWKSMFAAFMAGVVVVGGLMFASDKADLFTADAGVFNANNGGGASQNVQTASGDGNGSSVTNAAIDVVRPNNIAAIVDNSRAAVVKIETYAKVSSRSRSSIYDDDIFNWFFGNGGRSQPDSGQSSTQERKVGEGSGFIFDSEGYILTNQHVIDGAETIKVFVEGHDEPFVATTLGDSVDLDLAALKIESKNAFPYLKLGNVDQLSVGDWVVAIGNPYGYDHTVTVGVLSAKERPISIRDGNVMREYEHLLQTDASINPGNSGGPLLNLSGEVIGINTAVNAQAQGIGFAIPTSTISDVLDNLKNDKPIPKEPAPYVGVYLGELDSAAAEELGFKGTEGGLVTQVEVGGPAHKAGVQAWDIITEVAGTKVKTYEDVSKTVQSQKVGDKITMKVFRGGKTYEVAIVIGNRNAE